MERSDEGPWHKTCDSNQYGLFALMRKVRRIPIMNIDVRLSDNFKPLVREEYRNDEATY